MNILLVCTGNTCRSPMAAGFLSKEAGDGHVVGSAGIHAIPDMPASRHAIAVMADAGIDLSAHRARQVTDAMVEDADLILTMTVGHKEALLRRHPGSRGKVHALGEFVGLAGDIADPFGGTIHDYRRSADDIYVRVRSVPDRLTPLL